MSAVFNVLYSIVFWALVGIYTLFIGFFADFVALFISDEEAKKRFYQKTSIIWGTLILNSSLTRVEVEGLENVPGDTNVIFTPNHQSFVDVFVLLKYLPSPYKFIIMRKLFDVPFIGPHISKAGFISLDRKDRRNSVRVIQGIVDRLEEGWSIVVFPEGKLTTDGNVNKFQRGASIIVQRSKKPVVPICIDGTFKILPKGAWILRPGKVRLIVGKPVSFDKYHDNLNKISAEELGEEMRQVVVGLKE